jgi:hypothetical protein
MANRRAAFIKKFGKQEAAAYAARYPDRTWGWRFQKALYDERVRHSGEMAEYRGREEFERAYGKKWSAKYEADYPDLNWRQRQIRARRDYDKLLDQGVIPNLD